MSKGHGPPARTGGGPQGSRLVGRHFSPPSSKITGRRQVTGVLHLAQHSSRGRSEPPLYAAALDTLRTATLSGKDVGTVALLVRATAISSAAVGILTKMPLRTRAQRRDGVIAAAVALTSERDDADAKVAA